MTVSHWAPWSLRELVEQLRSGETTTSEALTRSRARIGATEPDLHAWVDRHAEQFHLADAADDSVLGGVPLGVKDIIDVAGYPTRCGSELRTDSVPADRDAAIITAWRSAGALAVGKTVTTEFAFFAPGPTANPADIKHTPGGSSSGSAAAVAAGQVPLALGSQTAGSVTRPASYCGAAALVMTHDRFPTDGITGLSPSLDSHGVYAAGVTDLALAWSALSGTPDVGIEHRRPPRVLVWRAGALGVVGPEMSAALDIATKRLEANAIRVDPLPDEAERLLACVADVHPVVMAYEAARERAEELAQASRLSKPLSDLLRTGADTPQHNYEAAIAFTRSAKECVRKLLGDDAVILCPAAPGPAPRGLEATGDPVLSRPWQALGLPVVTVPGLRDDAGMPLGLQVVGRPNGEADVLSAALGTEMAIAQ